MNTIHRIWLDDPMPPKFAEFGERWQELNPDWHVHDWTDSGTLPELQNQELFDAAESIYPNDWKRFQADILRLELLYDFGGVYVDTDIEPHKGIDPLLLNSVCLVGRSPQRLKRQKNHPITNAFMYSEAYHPFIRELVEEVPRSVKQYRNKHLSQCVGPWMLTRVYNRNRPYTKTVTVVPDLYSRGYFTHHWNTKKRKKGRGLG